MCLGVTIDGPVVRVVRSNDPESRLAIRAAPAAAYVLLLLSDAARTKKVLTKKDPQRLQTCRKDQRYAVLLAES